MSDSENVSGEFGPVYGAALLKSIRLPGSGNMLQAMPGAEELRQVESVSTRTVAAFEALTIRFRHAEDKCAELLRAIDRAGFDVCPCRLCGDPIICIPDGLPMCPACAEAESTYTETSDLKTEQKNGTGAA